mmetsp:Transcript_73929/g.175956  ORF Transcript_73929/g.175956 Transcript_73929/m.175956 type:complete len:247 (-) Transcript_73929:311-1051(-)
MTNEDHWLPNHTWLALAVLLQGLVSRSCTNVGSNSFPLRRQFWNAHPGILCVSCADGKYLWINFALQESIDLQPAAPVQHISLLKALGIRTLAEHWQVDIIVHNLPIQDDGAWTEPGLHRSIRLRLHDFNAHRRQLLLSILPGINGPLLQQIFDNKLHSHSWIGCFDVASHLYPNGSAATYGNRLCIFDSAAHILDFSSSLFQGLTRSWIEQGDVEARGKDQHVVGNRLETGKVDFLNLRVHLLND